MRHFAFTSRLAPGFRPPAALHLGVDLPLVGCAVALVSSPVALVSYPVTVVSRRLPRAAGIVRQPTSIGLARCAPILLVIAFVSPSLTLVSA